MKLREEDTQSNETVELTPEQLERMTKPCVWHGQKGLTGGQDCLQCEYQIKVGDNIVSVKNPAVRLSCDEFYEKIEEIYKF